MVRSDFSGVVVELELKMATLCERVCWRQAEL